MPSLDTLFANYVRSAFECEPHQLDAATRYGFETAFFMGAAETYGLMIAAMSARSNEAIVAFRADLQAFSDRLDREADVLEREAEGS
ncbi:hypothetical protein RCDURKIN_8 [Rhodobacter phage RcDurkin]|nr:hypothetical protein RCDURKIN_8 [Rhodobacter phage RcDurkin]